MEVNVMKCGAFFCPAFIQYLGRGVACKIMLFFSVHLKATKQVVFFETYIDFPPS